ncbi:MAG: penicillin acylase family protein [bacterium]|nr:penicillin acylase family protein [bacterium]
MFGLLLVGSVLVLWRGQAPFASSKALRRAEPVYDGSLSIEGLVQPIAIRRDARGVPHVRARPQTDAWFGLGFVHAQDRLGQMLWLRRLARGTTAELSGEEGLPVDRLVRTLGIGRAADREAAGFDAETHPALFAYAAGVNARLSRLDPAAVRALQGAPSGAPNESPWLPADSIAVMKLLGWTMGPSLDASLVFADLVETLGGVGARPLLPTGLGMKGVGLAFELPNGKPRVPLRTAKRRQVKSDLSRARAQLGATVLQMAAWVVPGSDSDSGSPLLAAEFALPPSVPSLVYEAHLVSSRFDAMGATVPGIPVYWTGRNANVAWALTPGRVNNFQLYRETVRRVGDLREAQHGRRWQAVETREETIRVRTFGGDIDEQILRITQTGHGPLINTLLPDLADPVSIDWTGASRGDALHSLMGLVRAESAEDLLERLADHHEPVVAVAYADREGAIGWQLAGWIPKRLLGSAQLPAPGNQLAFDWRDRLRFRSLPRGEGNAGTKHWVIAADNPLVEDTTNRQIEWNWRHGTRARRIERALARLRDRGAVDLRGLAEMQSRLTAQVSPRVIHSLETLLARAPALSPEAQEVWQLVQAWDGQLAPDRKGAAVYRVFVHDLVRRLLATKLPGDLVDRYLALGGLEPAVFAEGAIIDAAKHGRAGGWSDPELLAPLLPASLHQAWVSLSYQRGPSRSRWNWGGLHRLVFRPFVGFDVDAEQGVWEYGGDLPIPGQGGGVGMADYDVTRPYAARSASLYRIAVDLAADDRILTSLAPGQSEHPGQLHFRDGLGPWLNGNPRLVARSSFLVEEQTVDLLRLEPRS